VNCRLGITTLDVPQAPESMPRTSVPDTPQAGTITASLVIIGDEVLSGRTQDSNLNFLAKRLGQLGIQLREVRVIQDHAATIQNTINALRVRDDYVFTTGGIGPTHDDITAENIAAAFNVDLLVNAEAKSILAAYYAQRDIEFNASRLRMARIPDGASLIPNSISAAPGFRIENVFVMAGVPKIMQAMFESCTTQLKRGQIKLSRTLTCDLPEGLLAKPLSEIQNRFANVELGSYPGKFQSLNRVSIVARGFDEKTLETVEYEIKSVIKSLAGSILEIPTDS